MKKRILSLLMCSIVIATTFAGCGSTSSDKINGHKQVTINVGMWPQDNDKAGQALWKGYQAKMKKKYPYITLKPDRYEFSPDTFMPKAASGQLPTVYYAYYTEANKIMSANYAADITKYVHEYGYDKALNPTISKIYQSNGKYYGLPYDGYALGLYMNMNLFKKAGLVDSNGLPKYPKSFDELAQDAVIIKHKTGKAGMFIPTKDHVGGWQFVQLAWNFGAQFEKKVNGKWVNGINSPETVAALQYVKDLKWKYDVLLPSTLLGWDDWIKNFGTDQVGMVMAAPDAIINPVNDYKMSKDAIAMASIPSGSSGQYSLLGGDAYLVAPNATADQIDAVFKLFQVMGYTPKADTESLSGLESDLKSKASVNEPTGLPGLPVWVNKDRVDAQNNLYKKYRNVNYDLFKPYYDSAFNNVKVEEPYNTQDLYGVLDSCLQVVLTNKNADPKSVLDKAANDFQTRFLDKVK
ncbi:MULTISPECIES: ABC transporter substrate-binding protein [Clostridium]|uniref:ABC transporter substrate-binding protein n=1 Tax=Clostridium TaxID=1485 RepID=UPI0006C6E999|nr:MULTISPECIES: ABC transporter substrate-binding protein [Clostridium]KOF56038.1 ABC transporter substrate-binding protein [Clostridium sp. DMHC 10]MCD2345514.1 sugar ABC transporter substrate-binding protein [Clostridium guangxiense]